MTVETKAELTQSYITTISKELNEPDWLLQMRLEGYQLSQTLELPKPEKTSIRDWNVTDFRLDFEATPIDSPDELPEEVRQFIGKEAGKQAVLIHKNGRPIYTQLDEELKKQGVIFMDLHRAVQEHGDLVRRYLGQLVEARENKLAAVHTALFNCGVFLYVPKNVDIKLPLQCIWWQTAGDVGILPHILVVAESGSKVSYVENLLGEEAGSAVNHYVAEVFVGPGAKVTFAALDNLGEGVTNYVWRRAKVERDGHVEWALGQLHDGHTLSENLTLLHGDGSTAETKSVAVGRGDQSQNFVQKIVHIGKASDGKIIGHAVMKDSARGIFNGITKIEKGATKANGEQTERVLMLSEAARGDANPILLIDEDDVKAGHAASVGQIDKMQLYYLMSRGIPQEEAERLIILGFLNPVVEMMPIESIKNQLKQVIERKVKG